MSFIEKTTAALTVYSLAVLAVIVFLAPAAPAQKPKKGAAQTTAPTEQAAALALAPAAEATLTAVADGEYDNPATWGGRLPVDGDKLHVPTERIVLLDSQETARLAWLRVDGRFEFSPTENTQLLVETILVPPGGVFDIGTKVSPITASARVVFLDSGPFNYMGLARGLVGLGMVNIVGAERPAWDRAEALANDGRTRPSGLGRTVTLTSESLDVIRRGHVMLMHHPDFELAHFAIVGLGRTNKANPLSATNPRGRYPLHLHRQGFTKPVEITGVVVEDSPGWGIVNHSSFAHVRHCVTFNVLGAGFVTEAGDERGSFEHCLAVLNKGSGDRGGSLQIINESRKNIGDYGHLGDGFWLQGPLVALKHNVSTGAKFAGFDVFNSGFNEPDTKAQAFPLSRNTPLAEQVGNVARHSEFGGMNTWCFAEGSRLEEFTASDCKVGHFSNQSLVELHSPTFVRCGVGHDGGTDYGGPSRVYGGAFRECDVALDPGSTRWLSGHSILEGPFTFEGNTLDVRIRQADPGRTELINLGAAKVSWIHLTKGSLEVRQRLFYQESQREFTWDGRRAYFRVQRPDAKPWSSGELAGLTNAEIFAQTGKLPLGAIIPAGSEDHGEYWLGP